MAHLEENGWLGALYTRVVETTNTHPQDDNPNYAWKPDRLKSRSQPLTIRFAS
jgi:hypothetical protein